VSVIIRSESLEFASSLSGGARSPSTAGQCYLWKLESRGHEFSPTEGGQLFPPLQVNQFQVCVLLLYHGFFYSTRLHPSTFVADPDENLDPSDPYIFGPS
jgi:hypothetical protein